MFWHHDWSINRKIKLERHDFNLQSCQCKEGTEEGNFQVPSSPKIL